MTIGDPATAKMLAHHFQYRSPELKPAPKGFSRIGAGCYRVALLERATETVYKLGDYDANVMEAFTSRRLARKSTKSLGFTLKIPASRTYRTSPHDRIIAQEYAKGGKSTYCASQDDWMERTPECDCKRELCFKTVLDRITEFSGLQDIHGSNVLVDSSDTFWLIDMGL
jgi:hypothetical protein